jgi:uncharacterized damage-inducible protein DinB
MLGFIHCERKGSTIGMLSEPKYVCEEGCEMTSQSMVQALFGFNQTMNERLWTIIMEHLTDAQFTQVDGYSRGSIRNQLVHMANAQHYWLRGLLNIADLPELDPEDYPARAIARSICQKADQECLNSVCSLSQADLERMPDGWSLPVWVGMLQLAQHSTDHRAQILRALHNLGAPTFEQNFVIYMENATPVIVQDLIGQIGAKRAEWDDLLRRVPDGQMDQPVLDAWTVRDAIAILTWKEQQVVEIMRKRAVSEASFGQLPEAEQASLLTASRALPLPALLDKHQATHREMLEALQALTEDELNSEDVDGLPPDERFWKAIAGATWWSYPAFSGPLRQMLVEHPEGLSNRACG